MSISAYERDAVHDAPGRAFLRRPLVVGGAALLVATLVFGGYRLQREVASPVAAPVAAARSPLASVPLPSASAAPLASTNGPRPAASIRDGAPAR